MLPIFLVLCLASTQVFGAAVLSTAHADSKEAHDYAADSTHSDGEYQESSSSKDSAYAYDKGYIHSITDGQAAVVSHNAQDTEAFPVGPASSENHQTSYLNGHNEFEHKYDRGFGYNKEEESSKGFKFNNDASSQDGVYAAAAHEGSTETSHDTPAVPAFYYNNYVASPFLHGIHKRSVAGVYGYPAYYNNNGYYYGNKYHGFQPAYNHGGYYYGNLHAGVHKRSVAYGYGYPAYNNGYYYGNHHAGYPASYYNGYYGNHHGAYPYVHASVHKRSVSGYGYPAYNNGYYGNHHAAGYPAYHNGYGYGYPAYRYGSYGYPAVARH